MKVALIADSGDENAEALIDVTFDGWGMRQSKVKILFGATHLPVKEARKRADAILDRIAP